MKKAVGLFGGAFNPPSIAHMMVAAHAKNCGICD